MFWEKDELIGPTKEIQLPILSILNLSVGNAYIFFKN